MHSVNRYFLIVCLESNANQFLSCCTLYKVEKNYLHPKWVLIKHTFINLVICFFFSQIFYSFFIEKVLQVSFIILVTFFYTYFSSGIFFLDGQIWTVHSNQDTVLDTCIRKLTFPLMIPTWNLPFSFLPLTQLTFKLNISYNCSCWSFSLPISIKWFWLFVLLFITLHLLMICKYCCSFNQHRWSFRARCCLPGLSLSWIIWFYWQTHAHT